MRKQILLKDDYVYIYAPEHPYAAQGGYVAYHRLVAEEKFGKLILPDEIVHHIDGNVKNNDPDNLLVVTKTEHMRAHRATIAYNKEFLEREYITAKKPMQQIAAENGLSRQTIAKWIKYFNIPLRLDNAKVKSTVLSLSSQGFTQFQIAEALGISQMTVSRRLRDAKKHSD